MKKLELTNWNVAEEGVLHIPDELDKLFDTVESEVEQHAVHHKCLNQTTADIIYKCQSFFKKMYDK